MEDDLEGYRALVLDRDQDVPAGNVPKNRVGSAPVDGLHDVHRDRQAGPLLLIELLQPGTDLFLIGREARLELLDPTAVLLVLVSPAARPVGRRRGRPEAAGDLDEFPVGGVFNLLVESGQLHPHQVLLPVERAGRRNDLGVVVDGAIPARARGFGELREARRLGPGTEELGLAGFAREAGGDQGIVQVRPEVAEECEPGRREHGLSLGGGGLSDARARRQEQDRQDANDSRPTGRVSQNTLTLRDDLDPHRAGFYRGSTGTVAPRGHGPKCRTASAMGRPTQVMCTRRGKGQRSGSGRLTFER